jgi:hypothetical protein
VYLFGGLSYLSGFMRDEAAAALRSRVEIRRAQL